MQEAIEEMLLSETIKQVKAYIFWIPRGSNKEADKRSKEINYDCYLTFELVYMLSQK